MKKEFVIPTVLQAEVRLAYKTICGWFTCCGEQVRYDK